MQPADIQIIGDHLAVRWADQSETFLPLASLRRACPCAACKGETDVLGQLHKAPSKPLSQESFRLVRLSPVGSYGFQPLWGDGHSTGIFTHALLRSLEA